jgi:hypothetical protein
MRILADLGSLITTGNPRIIQVERTPEDGVAGGTNINGKFAISVVKGVEFPIDAASKILEAGDVDGKDVSSISYAHLLAMYPLLNNIYFNPLLTAANVDEIDFTAFFRDITTNPPNVYMFPVRVQTGRPAAFAIAGPAGQMPTQTAILPANVTTTPDRPGVLVTKEIDLSTYMPDGADNFLVYWKLYGFTTTHDVAHGTTNDPSIRTITESDQEPDDFKVYLSTDNGVTWCEAGLLEPVGFCDKSKKIRLAFVNRGTSKVFLATYAVLF